jgi:hypothetical protein
MNQVKLPRRDGTLETFRLSLPRNFARRPGVVRNRIAFSAAHVVSDPLADVEPWLAPAIDWDATLAYRHYLWDLGLGVAEAMDTAQRGMGLDWAASQELIRRSVAEARASGNALVASGAGTDHLLPAPDITTADVIAAYEEQCSTVEAAGGQIILMASRALAACSRGPDDFAEVYGRVLAQVRQPVILHWLGEMFDSELDGYWGYADHWKAMEVCLAVIEAHAAKIDGIKISLLSEEKEIAMRARMPEGVRMYTGDDFNYPRLIAGDGTHFSHALLGIFDAIAPAAASALDALADGDLGAYEEVMAPTVPLSRHIFKSPTRFYKTGIVFLAWLNGFQSHFTMIGGQESARSTLHLAELFRLASQAGLLRDPELAAARMGAAMRLRGIGA